MTHRSRGDESADDREILLTALTWPVLPVHLSEDGVFLRVSLHDEDRLRHAKVPSSGLLLEFCRLARDGISEAQRRGEIHRFARRYGLLLLCQRHRQPAAGCRIDGGCDFQRWGAGTRGAMGVMDSVEDWALWARRFDGTQKIAAPIMQHRPLRSVDVENAFAEIDNRRWQNTPDMLRRPSPSGVTQLQPDGSYRPIPTHRTAHGRWKRQSREVEVFQLQEWLNYLLQVSAVSRRVVPGRGHQMLAIADAFHTDCPLFGALVTELVGQCTGVASQSVCLNGACGKGFRPRHQNQRYCSQCRRLRVPQQLATKRRRDSLRAKGLSSRSRPL